MKEEKEELSELLTELRGCVRKGEVAALVFPSLIVLTVSVDVKQHLKKMSMFQSSGVV